MSDSLQITVVGAGYVGLATTAMLVEIGHRVTVLDTAPDRIALLLSGRTPITEPGLDDILTRALAEERLAFTTDPDEAYPGAAVAYVCVSTPAAPNGEADLTNLYESIDVIARTAPDTVVVVKSTVPPGTQRALRSRLPGLKFVSSPEFLQQGSAVAAALNPDRIVVGTDDLDARATMHTLFAPFEAQGVPIVDTDPESAELIKYASNSFLAMKIAFINEIADLCEATGADIDDVAYGTGLDPRIGDRFFNAGPGYGGSCFPKDTVALVESAKDLGVDLSIVDAAAKSNRRRRTSLSDRVLRLSDKPSANLRIGVLGATFKAGTDDLRESPAVDVILGLARSGADVVVFDPLGDVTAAPEIHGIEVAESAREASTGADILVVATEWPEFTELDFSDIAAQMRGTQVIDLRNILDPEAVSAAGLTLHQIGKASRGT
jgi:UDPglucose 6-dehydrogenase